jgi:DNA polymerase III gamma/tau subunit
VIDLNKFSEKQQNQFLKFIEEPSKSVYIVLIANSEVNVLNTVLNRCTKHYFEPYTKEEVELITNTTVNDLAFKIFKTPGKLKMLTEKSFTDTLTMATTIVAGQRPANYAQFLALITQVNFKDLYDKVDLQLLLDAVEYLAFNDFVQNRSKQSGRILELTTQFRQHAVQSTFIKEMLMVNYLLHVWEISNGTA